MMDPFMSLNAMKGSFRAWPTRTPRAHDPGSATRSGPRRRDAQANLARILSAAADVFAERGLTATLADVAKAAGVGVGTVYRTFATKDSTTRWTTTPAPRSPPRRNQRRPRVARLAAGGSGQPAATGPRSCVASPTGCPSWRSVDPRAAAVCSRPPTTSPRSSARCSQAGCQLRCAGIATWPPVGRIPSTRRSRPWCRPRRRGSTRRARAECGRRPLDRPRAPGRRP